MFNHHHKTIAVTGGTGYVASHTILQLLADTQRNYKVIATVRSPKKADFLKALPHAQERLTFVQADLLDEASFDFTGVDVVLHIASPYTLTAKDPQKELVDPALKGTLNVLRAAKKYGVKHVVVTSSLAAVTDEPGVGHIFTEDDWNTKSTLERNPYYYSKTLAERAAHDFVKENPGCFKLTTILPTFVIGPSLNGTINETVDIIHQLCNGKVPTKIDLAFPLVDVRDVARAHILAFETGHEGRYLCCGPRTINMDELVELIEKTQPELKKVLPCITAPYPMVWASSWFYSRDQGTFFRLNAGGSKGYKVSVAKIQRDLGIALRPVEDTVRDTVLDLQKWGQYKV